MLILIVQSFICCTCVLNLVYAKPEQLTRPNIQELDNYGYTRWNNLKHNVIDKINEPDQTTVEDPLSSDSSTISSSEIVQLKNDISVPLEKRSIPGAIASALFSYLVSFILSTPKTRFGRSYSVAEAKSDVNEVSPYITESHEPTKLIPFGSEKVSKSIVLEPVGRWKQDTVLDKIMEMINEGVHSNEKKMGPLIGPIEFPGIGEKVFIRLLEPVNHSDLVTIRLITMKPRQYIPSSSHSMLQANPIFDTPKYIESTGNETEQQYHPQYESNLQIQPHPFATPDKSLSSSNLKENVAAGKEPTNKRSTATNSDNALSPMISHSQLLQNRINEERWNNYQSGTVSNSHRRWSTGRSPYKSARSNVLRNQNILRRNMYMNDISRNHKRLIAHRNPPTNSIKYQQIRYENEENPMMDRYRGRLYLGPELKQRTIEDSINVFQGPHQRPMTMIRDNMRFNRGESTNLIDHTRDPLAFRDSMLKLKIKNPSDSTKTYIPKTPRLSMNNPSMNMEKFSIENARYKIGNVYHNVNARSKDSAFITTPPSKISFQPRRYYEHEALHEIPAPNLRSSNFLSRNSDNDDSTKEEQSIEIKKDIQKLKVNKISFKPLTGNHEILRKIISTTGNHSSRYQRPWSPMGIINIPKSSVNPFARVNVLRNPFSGRSEVEEKTHSLEHIEITESPKELSNENQTEDNVSLERAQILKSKVDDDNLSREGITIETTTVSYDYSKDTTSTTIQDSENLEIKTSDSLLGTTLTTEKYATSMSMDYENVGVVEQSTVINNEKSNSSI